MAELVDALDSKSSSFGSVGSIPTSGTKTGNCSEESDSPFFIAKKIKPFKTNVLKGFLRFFVVPLGHVKFLCKLWYR